MMTLGEIIRKYRKDKNMTQEEMAGRLGVTAPAVNKWENGVSMPDIMLLAPIARLLGITVDTLLSFQETLTAEEINDLLGEAQEMLKKSTYEISFQWACKVLAQYPNCEPLLWQMAVLFDAQRMFQDVPDEDAYDEQLLNWYQRALESRDETIRNGAADSLFGFYMRKEAYDKAESYLSYFSNQNPERKRKQAQLYGRTGRIREAYKAYEELLVANYQVISAVLQGMNILALQTHDMKKAHMLADKLSEAAHCFDMGQYYEVSCQLEAAVQERDADTVLTIMETMLSCVEEIGSFSRSPLYEHMAFKPVEPEFTAHLKAELKKSFKDPETYDFLQNDERWKALCRD